MGNLPQTTFGLQLDGSAVRRLGKHARRSAPTLAGESGQGLVEYSLILLLVSVVAIPLLDAIGLSVTGFLLDVADHVGDV
jgi:Flp pilus assembly pilin Flp